MPSPSDTTFPVMTAERRVEHHKEQQLLVRYHHGDLQAREELINRFLPLARQLARRYQYTSEPLDDLFQVAAMGLVKAIDRFDPERGTAFTSYAYPIILGELKRYFRDNAWTIHVPRGARERSVKVRRMTDVLSLRLGRSPSVDEIAAELDIDAEAVLEALEAAAAYEPASLDVRRGDEEDGETLVDTLGSIDKHYELVENRTTIMPALQHLDPRERLVLQLRFIDDLTQAEIADRIGVSQMHVSRLIRRALTHMQGQIAID
jgi:RNA polymerase sigma-B factor